MALAVELTTAHLPPIPLGGASSSGGAGGRFASWLLRQLRPRVRVLLDGVQLVDLAPVGNPPPTSWPLVPVVLGVVLALVVLLAVRGVVAAVRGS